MKEEDNGSKQTIRTLFTVERIMEDPSSNLYEEISRGLSLNYEYM